MIEPNRYSNESIYVINWVLANADRDLDEMIATARKQVAQARQRDVEKGKGEEWDDDGEQAECKHWLGTHIDDLITDEISEFDYGENASLTELVLPGSVIYRADYDDVAKLVLQNVQQAKPQLSLVG